MDEEYLDNLAREIYRARAQMRGEITDEHWERIKQRFGASYRICLAAAEELLTRERY